MTLDPQFDDAPGVGRGPARGAPGLASRSPRSADGHRLRRARWRRTRRRQPASAACHLHGWIAVRLRRRHRARRDRRRAARSRRRLLAASQRRLRRAHVAGHRQRNSGAARPRRSSTIDESDGGLARPRPARRAAAFGVTDSPSTSAGPSPPLSVPLLGDAPGDPRVWIGCRVPRAFSGPAVARADGTPGHRGRRGRGDRG